MRSSLISAFTALSLIAAPTVSLAAGQGDARALSLSGARVGAPARDANRMDESGYIIAGVAGLAVIILIIVLIDDGNEGPSSP
ncbi:MAG: hypothetical protein ACJ8DZ_03375 [Allosphingosinicella sp.]